MEILGNICTAFAVIFFGGQCKTHYCPRELVGGLVSDLEARGHSAKEVEEASKGGIDLPGMAMMDAPWEDIMIGEFKFSVPTLDFEYILQELMKVEVRKFSDGQEYFKIHGNFHCLVLTPDQRNELLDKMCNMLDEVTKRADEASEEFSRRLARMNKGRTRFISHRDKNDPYVARIPESPKDNN